MLVVTSWPMRASIRARSRAIWDTSRYSTRCATLSWRRLVSRVFGAISHPKRRWQASALLAMVEILELRHVHFAPKTDIRQHNWNVRQGQKGLLLLLRF